MTTEKSKPESPEPEVIEEIELLPDTVRAIPPPRKPPKKPLGRPPPPPPRRRR